jgi:O-antigen/teichoic acid export membrane protein
MPLMIRMYGDADFGKWILIASFLGYALILDMRLPLAVTRFVFQEIGRNDDGVEIGRKKTRLSIFFSVCTCVCSVS